QVYTQIIADLNQSITLMSNQTGPTNHASVGAAHALLARVYLYQGNNAQALAEAQLVDGFGYALTPSYPDLFNRDDAETSENIFKLTFTSNLSQANLLGYYWLSDALDVGAGRYELAPTQDLIDAYDTTGVDVRFHWNIAPDPSGDGYVEGSAYGT